jgi:hypothetical protein
MTNTKQRSPARQAADHYAPLFARAALFRRTAERRDAQAQEYRDKADAMEAEALLEWAKVHK